MLNRDETKQIKVKGEIGEVKASKESVSVGEGS